MKQLNSNNYINQEEVSTYLKDLRKIQVMTVEREKELSEKMKNENLTQKEKESIEKELVQGNLRFVISVAKQYQNQGLDFSDLVAEGNLGLLKAIKNFDWSKDLRFISYAVWWVRQSIIQSLNDNARTIRLPVNVVQEFQKAKRENQVNGSEIDEKFALIPSMVGLDLEINEDGDTLIDVIKNDNAVEPDHTFNSKDLLKEALMKILSNFDDREKSIIEDYFGLYGQPKTLEDIGEELNLTKERVRQIKQKVLKKIRNESLVLFNHL